MTDDDVRRYVDHGHSREWVKWWLAFCASFTGRLTKDQEREWFLIDDSPTVEAEPLSLGL